MIIRGEGLHDRRQRGVELAERPAVFQHQEALAFKTANSHQAHEFNAYYIPMVQTADVRAGNSHYVLPVPTIAAYGRDDHVDALRVYVRRRHQRQRRPAG
jgi:hypothetical protein